MARSRRSILCLLLGATAIVASLTLGGACPAQAAPSRAAVERFLEAEHGLKRARNSNLWKVPVHDQLRARHAELPQLRQTIVTTQRQIDSRIDDNARLWQSNQRRLTELQRILASLGSDDAKRKPVEQQMAALRRAAVTPSELAGVSDVRAALVGLSNARVRLHLSLHWIRERTRDLVAQYERLAADPDVQQALAAWGDEATLASPQPLVDSLRGLSEYDELLRTESIPIYLLGDTARFSAIINETVPVTLSLRSEGNSLILPPSQAAACGVHIPSDAETHVETIGRQRISTRRATVPYLQIGPHLVRDVPALILPADREDLGAQLGPAAIPDLEIVEDRDRLRLVVRRKQ